MRRETIIRFFVSIILSGALILITIRLLDFLQGNVRIIFYGRIVDEHGDGVPGARVTGHVTAVQRLSVPIGFANTQTAWPVSATTDSSGCFKIDGGYGHDLRLEDARVPGFGEFQSRDYDFSPSDISKVAFIPDQNRPEIFHIWKKKDAADPNK